MKSKAEQRVFRWHQRNSTHKKLKMEIVAGQDENLLLYKSTCEKDKKTS